MIKIVYVLTRDLGFFALPLMRLFRNFVYSRHLNARGIVVDSFVRIQPLHSCQEKSLFGRDLHVGWGVVVDLSGGVRIGDRVTISEGARIYTHDHPVHGGDQNWRKNAVTFSSLEIGDDVWIASNAIVLSSVRKIGTGAIVAAGSVVSSDVGDLEIVAGVPARKIGIRKLGSDGKLGV